LRHAGARFSSEPDSQNPLSDTASASRRDHEVGEDASRVEFPSTLRVSSRSSYQRRNG
jgi:hypothetical protein